MDKQNDKHYLVLFDGVCNLCCGFVQFILKHEKAPTLSFASFQSTSAVNILNKFDISLKSPGSIIYMEDSKVFIKSDAVMKISEHLKFPWSAVSRMKWIPLFIRNGFYDFIAENRYSLFRKKSNCWVPQTKWKNRFIE